MSSAKESDFAAQLAILELTQVELAIAFIWLKTSEVPGYQTSISEIADFLHGHALSARINAARLKAQLSKHRSTVKGVTSNTFRLRLASVADLTARFGLLASPAPKKVSHILLPDEQTRGTRRYIERIAIQINGSYEQSFYDGAAVLMRRLIETLLISVFEHKGCGGLIKNGQDYLPLGDLIGLAGSGQHFKLGRGGAKSLERIKAVGDSAAHKLTYNTGKTDIDEIAHEFRTLVSDLINLGNLQARG